MPESTRRPRFPDRFVPGLVAICAAAFGLRLLYVMTFSRHLQFGLDTVWYELVAGTVADGKGFIDPGRFYGHGVAVATAFRPPLYPVFLALVSKTIGGGRTDYQVAGCMLGTITVGLVGVLGRRFGGPAVGLTAAALAALSPALIGIDASVMAETLYVPLVACTLLALLRASDRPTVARWSVAGMFAGAATLARGDGALLVLVVVAPTAFLFTPKRGWRRTATASAALLGALVMVAPWLVRNEVKVHRATLATLDAGTAVAGANCPSTYYGSRLGSWDFACTQVAGPSASELQGTDILQRRGLRYATSHPRRVPLVVAARVARQWGLWNPVTEARLEVPESRNFEWQLITWGFDTAVLALAVIGFVTRRRDRIVLIPVLLIVAVTVDAVLVYGKQRFQAAALPALLVLAALALVSRAPRRGVSPPPDS